MLIHRLILKSHIHRAPYELFYLQRISEIFGNWVYRRFLRDTCVAVTY
jgi:hypothetical protein